MTLIEELATWVAGLRQADLPSEVLGRARLQAASALAAALGSAKEAGVQKVLRGLRGRLGRSPHAAGPSMAGQARLLATGEPMPVHEAVLGSATATCAFDWDEILLLGHPSHSAVTVAFCLGEALGASFGDVLTAQVAANELAGRFGLACFFGPQNGQHLPFVHHVGAAAAASRLLGLDAEATADALAIALAQPQTALWPAFLGDLDSKVLTAAHPAELGLAAAEHAAAGVRGPRGILEHPRGFFHRFAFLPAPRALGGLGRAWLTNTMQIKTHAACWYFQAPLTALFRLRAQAHSERGRPPVPADVSRLTCEATALAMAVHGLSCQTPETEGLRPNTVNFRLDYSLGLLLGYGRLTPSEMDSASLARDTPWLRALAARTTIRHGLEHTQQQLLAVHRALDVPALLGHPGPLALALALGRGRREFPGVAARLAGKDLGRTIASLFGGLLAVRRSAPEGIARGATDPVDDAGAYDVGAYDLGARARAAALARLALPCGATVTLCLRDGWEASETISVPEGFLGGSLAAPLVGRKVTQAFEAAGRAEPEARAAKALAALTDAPPDARVSAVLDAWFSGGTPGRDGGSPVTSGRA